MPRYAATGINVEPGYEPEFKSKEFNTFNRPTLDPKYKETTLKPGDLTDSDTKTNIIVELDANPKFDVVDLLMAQFAWEACQLDRGFGYEKKNKRIDAKLSSDEKKKIEDLLENYRVYVQNNISITRVSYGMRPYEIHSASSSASVAASSQAYSEGEKS
jgi:hypothetical protein